MPAWRALEGECWAWVPAGRSDGEGQKESASFSPRGRHQAQTDVWEPVPMQPSSSPAPRDTSGQSGCCTPTRPPSGLGCGPRGGRASPQPWALQPWMTRPLGASELRAGLRDGTGTRASVPESGLPDSTDRGGNFSMVGMKKASLPTDTSPACPAPARLGLKLGIPPLWIHSFGLEYKPPSEEATLEPSSVRRASYALAGWQGLCHSTGQLACTHCVPGCCTCSGCAKIGQTLARAD